MLCVYSSIQARRACMSSYVCLSQRSRTWPDWSTFLLSQPLFWYAASNAKVRPLVMWLKYWTKDQPDGRWLSSSSLLCPCLLCFQSISRGWYSFFYLTIAVHKLDTLSFITGKNAKEDNLFSTSRSSFCARYCRCDRNANKFVALPKT